MAEQGSAKEPAHTTGEPEVSGLAWLRPAVLRRFDQGERSATWLELFFDLCFVVAVAALASYLHSNPTLSGLLHFGGLFVPIWWAWMGFTWHATSYDTDDVPYRLTFFAAMLTIVVLAASLEGIKHGDSTGFVMAFAALQALLVWLYLRARHYATEDRTMCTRFAIGYAVGGLVWLASLLVGEPARYWVWGLGIVVLMGAPTLAVRAFAQPMFDSSHIPERYGLFTIIVLGESIVAVAAVTADIGWSPGSAVAGAAGFGIAICYWWIYFEFVTASALTRDDLVRAFIWGYGHLAIYVGIAATAVGVEFAVEGAAEGHALKAVERAVLGGGLLAYLVGIITIHLATIRGWDSFLGVRVAAVIVILGLSVGGSELSAPLFMGLLLTTILGVSIFETIRHVRFATPTSPAATEPAG